MTNESHPPRVSDDRTARSAAPTRTAERASAPYTNDQHLTLVRRTSPWVPVLSAIIILAALGLLLAFGRNERLEWGVVAEYFFSPRILQGLWVTVWLTLVTVVAGSLLGIPLAFMRTSKHRVFAFSSWVYLWFFRSVPLLVQLLFWFNMGAIFPSIALGFPFAQELSQFSESRGGATFEWAFIEIDTRRIMTGLSAALIGLILHESAVAAEILRGGLNSVDHGQVEAAEALGLSKARIFVRIIFPQAMHSVIPPLGNMVIQTLKGTSIVSVIAVSDLLYVTQSIYATTFQVLPLLVVATCWYLILTSLLGIGQHFLEQRYSQGMDRSQVTSTTDSPASPAPQDAAPKGPQA